jgi:aryl sulfotransferase
MSGIVWLASFPKSGNTWTRIFLTNYQRNSEVPADINDLEPTPISAARVKIEDALGIDLADLTADEIDVLRPAAYRRMAAAAVETQFMKVHDGYYANMRGEPLLSGARAVVYIVRNPLDVCVSWAKHSGITLESSVEFLCSPAANVGSSDRAIAEQLRQHVGGWTGHVRSWTEQRDMPVHVMRYEDMLRDPHAAFGDMLRFVGVDVETERLNRAVRHSSFDELKKQEKEKGFREAMKQGESGFFGSGRSGGWRTKLSAEHAEALVRAHADTMRAFGYESDCSGFEHFQ